nr:MAG TPA: hypothetical protein [Caudoviricetes sp.]
MLDTILYSLILIGRQSFICSCLILYREDCDNIGCIVNI